jgi:hypothetical protein
MARPQGASAHELLPAGIRFRDGIRPLAQRAHRDRHDHRARLARPNGSPAVAPDGDHAGGARRRDLAFEQLVRERPDIALTVATSCESRPPASRRRARLIGAVVAITVPLALARSKIGKVRTSARR